MDNNNNNNKEKNFSKTSYENLLKTLVLGAILAILGVILLHAVAVFYILRPENFSADKMEATLLSSGVSVIGIALAAWAGLNISNAVNASHLFALQKESENLQIKSSKLAENLDERAKIIFHRIFLNELARTQRDLPVQEIAPCFKNPEDGPFNQLIEIELMYSQCALRHKSEYCFDEFLIATASAAINKIDKLLYERTCTYSRAVICYLEYRKYNFWFYMGYCDETREKCIDDFKNVPSDFSSFNDLFRRVKGTISTESRDFILNMIGEAQSKILQNYIELNKNQAENPDITELASNAVEMCKKAFEHSKDTKIDGTLKSTYCRNYGCALERCERISPEEEENHAKIHAKIIEVYEEAFHLIINDINGNIAARKNAYYVLLSYYKKYIDRSLDFDKEQDVQKAIDKLKGNTDLFSELAELAKKMERISIIAQADFPNASYMHAYYGFSNAYLAIFSLVSDNLYDAQKYTNMVILVKTDMETMNIKDAYYNQISEYVKRLSDIERTENDVCEISI